MGSFASADRVVISRPSVSQPRLNLPSPPLYFDLLSFEQQRDNERLLIS